MSCIAGSLAFSACKRSIALVNRLRVKSSIPLRLLAAETALLTVELSDALKPPADTLLFVPLLLLVLDEFERVVFFASRNMQVIKSFKAAFSSRLTVVDRDSGVPERAAILLLASKFTKSMHSSIMYSVTSSVKSAVLASTSAVLPAL